MAPLPAFRPSGSEVECFAAPELQTDAQVSGSCAGRVSVFSGLLSGQKAGLFRFQFAPVPVPVVRTVTKSNLDHGRVRCPAVPEEVRTKSGTQTRAPPTTRARPMPTAKSARQSVTGQPPSHSLCQKHRSSETLAGEVRLSPVSPSLRCVRASRYSGPSAASPHGTALVARGSAGSARTAVAASRHGLSVTSAGPAAAAAAAAAAAG